MVRGDHRVDAGGPQAAHLLVGQGAVGCAEPEVVGEAAVTGRQRVAAVDVEQLERLEQVTARTSQRALDRTRRDGLLDDESQVDVGRWESADRRGQLGSSRHPFGVEQDAEVEVEPSEPPRPAPLVRPFRTRRPR